MSALEQMRQRIALKRAAWNRMILDEYERPTYPPRLSFTQYPVRCPSCRSIVAACEDLGNLRWSCLSCAHTWLEAA